MIEISFVIIEVTLVEIFMYRRSTVSVLWLVFDDDIFDFAFQ